MSRHLDLDDLADLLAGEGTETAVRHVAGCPGCSAALDDLDRAQAPVQAALAGLPAPAVPDDLPARLDAALLAARERDDLATTAAGAHGSAARPPTVVPLHRVRRRQVSPERLLAGAAGVVLLLVVGVVALANTRGGGVGTTSSSAGSAAAPAGPPAVPTSSTGTDYDSGPEALGAALPQLLQGSTDPRQSITGAPGGGADDPLARLRDPAALAGCLAGLRAPAGPRPLALDYARFAGQPALVAVLPAGDPARLVVYVVGAGCRPGSPETLLTTQLARPS